MFDHNCEMCTKSKEKNKQQEMEEMEEMLRFIDSIGVGDTLIDYQFIDYPSSPEETVALTVLLFFYIYI